MRFFAFPNKKCFGAFVGFSDGCRCRRGSVTNSDPAARSSGSRTESVGLAGYARCPRRARTSPKRCERGRFARIRCSRCGTHAVSFVPKVKCVKLKILANGVRTCSDAQVACGEPKCGKFRNECQRLSPGMRRKEAVEFGAVFWRSCFARAIVAGYDHFLVADSRVVVASGCCLLSSI